MKRELPSESQDRILRFIAAAGTPSGVRSAEIEAAVGMTAGEMRMAMKWLSANGFVTGKKRRVKFNFGHQGSAFKALMFWTLTEIGAHRAATIAAAARTE